MSIRALLDAYRQIKEPNSPQGSVHEFYDTFLNFVFQSTNGFRVGLQREPLLGQGLGGSKQTYLGVRYVVNRQRTIVVCANREEEGEPQDSVWALALEQALEYCRMVHTEEEGDQSDKNVSPLYLTVNIGTCLRFYALQRETNLAMEWDAGRSLELADDEEEVWKFWQQLLTGHSSV